MGGEEAAGMGVEAAMALVMGTPRRCAFIGGDEAVWPSEGSPWKSGGGVDAINGQVDSCHVIMLHW